MNPLQLLKSLKIPHLSITQAGLVAIANAAITQLIAYVPAWAPEKQKLIALAGIVISAAFVVSNAVHYAVNVIKDLIKAGPSVDLPGIEGHIRTVVQDELSKINLNQLIKDIETGREAQIVQNVINRFASVVSQGPAPVAPPPPVSPIPPPPTA